MRFNGTKFKIVYFDVLMELSQTSLSGMFVIMDLFGI